MSLKFDWFQIFLAGFAQKAGATEAFQLFEESPEPFVQLNPITKGQIALFSDDSEAFVPASPLACGSNNYLAAGNELRIQSPSYPENPPKYTNCSWTFAVAPSVVAVLNCNILHVPCDSGDRLKFLLNGQVISKYCTKPVDRVLENAASAITFDKGPRSSGNNTLEINFGSEGNAMSKGFDCLVRGQSKSDTMPQLPPKEIIGQPPNHPSCGLTFMNRIVGGGKASDDEYPWAAGLAIGKHFCGGTIINQRWLLTAAHCIQDVEDTSQVIALLGCSYIGSDDIDCDQYRFSDRVIPHPDYSRPSGQAVANDIGLIHVTKDITFNPKVMPSCLAGQAIPVDGTGLMAVGWGKTSGEASNSEVLREVTYRILAP
eukprot:maker-scaffold304_size215464-snap-gene-1.25 protein:Tk10792 transcript:maker-scaffold304_size215464-snap-gene-1.25-mRNA-1 annotation:"af357226_1cub-serine protease"